MAYLNENLSPTYYHSFLTTPRVLLKFQNQITRTPRFLGTNGWNARYDFKIAVFSEFIQDIDSSVKSYEYSYQLILDILLGINPEDNDKWNLGSDRRVEARNLLDCINLKVF